MYDICGRIGNKIDIDIFLDYFVGASQKKIRLILSNLLWDLNGTKIKT